MTTMHTQASHMELPTPLTSIRPQWQAVYEPLPNSPSYGVELVFGGKIYQLFSNYVNAPANTVLLHGKRHLCHEPLKVFFQEFRKYVLGPRFGLVADKHQMILGLEGLDDPLICEIEAENDDCTLWEFWEQACDPTLRFELHTSVEGTLKDNEALPDDDTQSILDEPQQQEEESATHMTNIDPEEIVISSPMSLSSSSAHSSPSSPHDSSLASEGSAKHAKLNFYLDQHIVLDVDQKTVMDLNKKLVMNLEKRTVMDLTKGTILDLDKKTLLYVNKKYVLDLDNCAIRNMTQRFGLGTAVWNNIVPTQRFIIDPAVRTGQKSRNDFNGDVSSGHKQGGHGGLAAYSDDEDLISDTLSVKRNNYDEDNYDDLSPYQDSEYFTTDRSWAKRKDGDGYDADVSDQSSEYCGRFRSSKKVRMERSGI
ncbi:MAG: hypothetical protein BYD32DRAFT_466318 [Podila humilis]|nr:MAG: hypothetical protein BYD32DRAFT_466318 [Podila humilis]